MDRIQEKSCGIVPYTGREKEILYLLIKAEKGDCGFPKGHVEIGESELETALRETWEEASLQPVVCAGFRYETSYCKPNGNEKTAVYFLGDFGNQTPCQNEGFEKFEFLLLPFDKACRALTFENMKDLLARADKYLQNKKLP